MSEFKQFKTPEIIFIDDCDYQYNFHKLWLAYYKLFFRLKTETAIE